MEIINRIKQILVNPHKEWQTIEEENNPHLKVFTTYVVPLALIPAIATFIGYGVIGFSLLNVSSKPLVFIGLLQAIFQYVTMLGGMYISALIINTLAENFGATKNFNRAFSLVAYAYTPVFVAGVFYVAPLLGVLASLVGLYGLYLLYIGLQPMMKNPAEKQTSYFIVSLVVIIAVSAIFYIISGAIIAFATLAGALRL